MAVLGFRAHERERPEYENTFLGISRVWVNWSRMHV